MPNQDDTMLKIEAMLQDLLRWYKAVNFTALQRTLKEALPDEPKQVAYECTTSDRTSEEIATILTKLGHKISSRTIRLWQTEWITKGLVRQVSERKRKRNFRIVDFDISLPPALSKITECRQESSEPEPQDREDSEPQDQGA